MGNREMTLLAALIVGVPLAACAREVAAPTPAVSATPAIATSADVRPGGDAPAARVLDFGPQDDDPADATGGVASARPPPSVRPAAPASSALGPCGCPTNDMQCIVACNRGGSAAAAVTTPAATALGAIASNLASCKRPGGPSGYGKVKVTFQPSGAVSAAELIEGSFAGTSVGGCILARFRVATIPPFGGSAVPANKSFVIP